MSALANLKKTVEQDESINEGLFSLMYLIDTLYKNDHSPVIEALRKQIHSIGIPSLTWESLERVAKEYGKPLPDWFPEAAKSEIQNFNETIVSMKRCLDLAYAGSKDEAIKYLKKIMKDLNVPKLENFHRYLIHFSKGAPSWLTAEAQKLTKL